MLILANREERPPGPIENFWHVSGLPPFCGVRASPDGCRDRLLVAFAITILLLMVGCAHAGFDG
jgi:hypothetical protein